MKFTPEIVAALQTLKDAAENDFERHRIAVLERDLTAPPEVEIVDETHRKFDGIIFRLTKKEHFVATTNIHREVWTYHNGEIPDGYEIHHLDENPDNNTIENLQCLTKSEHQALHMKTSTRHENRKRTLICKQCGKEYVGYLSGNNRFCSEECRKAFYTVERVCEVCGKTFKTRTPESRFCSPACQGKHRHDMCRITKTCPTCGKEFAVARCSEQKYCSFECYSKRPRENPPAPLYEERTCVICGKTFSVYKYDKTQACSPTCGAKLSWQHRKNSP